MLVYSLYAMHFVCIVFFIHWHFGLSNEVELLFLFLSTSCCKIMGYYSNYVEDWKMLMIV